MFYNIISGQIVFFPLFKVYWFRLKTIKSGQNRVNLAVVGSYAFKNQSLQRRLYKLPGTQHLLKARLHGSMEVNSYFPFTISWCHWKKINHGTNLFLFQPSLHFPPVD